MSDKTEFTAYLRGCTDRQVRGVYEKEREARRLAFAELAAREGFRRGFDVRGGVPETIPNGFGE